MSQELSFTDIVDALAVNNASYFQNNLDKVFKYRTPVDTVLPAGTPMANFGKISNGTILMLAAMYPKISPTIVDILKAGLARCTDSTGRTALIIAACKDVAHVCAALAPLEANMRNNSLRSALMWSCRLGNVNCARILCDYEDVNSIDANGVSVLEWAKKSENNEVVAIIEDAIARQAAKKRNDEVRLQVEVMPNPFESLTRSDGSNSKSNGSSDQIAASSQAYIMNNNNSNSSNMNINGNNINSNELRSSRIRDGGQNLDLASLADGFASASQRTANVALTDTIQNEKRLDLNHCAINASGYIQCQICYTYLYPSALEAHLITCKKTLENRGLLKVVFDRIRKMGACSLDDRYLMNSENMSIIKALMPIVINTSDEDGTFCLLVAASCNNMLVASLFAEKEIFMADKNGTTAIQIALQMGKSHLDMVRLLYSVESINSTRTQRICGAMNGMCRFKGSDETVTLHRREKCQFRGIKCVLCGEDNIPATNYIVNHLLSSSCPILKSIFEKSQTKYSIRQFIEYVLSVLNALNSSSGGIPSLEHVVRTLRKLLEQINTVWESTRRLISSTSKTRSSSVISEQQACSDVSVKASIAVIYEENITKINNFNRAKESLDSIFEITNESITENEYSVIIYLLFRCLLDMLEHN